jgi:hypothetical protein
MSGVKQDIKGKSLSLLINNPRSTKPQIESHSFNRFNNISILTSYYR